ncbi:MAG: hypothetical protein Q8R81_01210 [Novosphingobium sp.]|uniref:hypothetical protein n=1 Tax=Novosphingobium sp. TaxID=1874826 RepID=UPI002735492A|nr:hypothetical protein [Novosphingobium sp.]MDP3548994.1 hypothetical protein [Novosphingobium sp.]
MTSGTGRKTARIAFAACLLLAGGPLCAQSSNGVGTPFELTFWQSVAGSDDPAVYEAYLAQYPAGTFSGLAKAKVMTLRRAVPVPVVAVPAPAVVQPAVAAAQPVVAKAESVTPPASDAALLSELAKSQEAGAGTTKVLAAQGFALPARPALQDVADLPLPTTFCSADQRNAFYETRYKPVLELARTNNAAAIAHMQALQQAYDSHQLSRDPTPMNALASEARDYQQQVAAVTYSRQAAVVRQFDAVMAVPVTSCQLAEASK